MACCMPTVLHFLFNSLWFLIFGSVIARRLGALRFIVLVAAATAAGALASLIVYWGEAAIMMGASGAVSGIMAAAIPVMFGRGHELGRAYRRISIMSRRCTPVELLRNRSAVIFTLVWIAITLYSGATGWTGAGYLEEARIAWEAHLGGFIAGLFGFYCSTGEGVRGRNRRDRVTPHDRSEEDCHDRIPYPSCKGRAMSYRGANGNGAEHCANACAEPHRRRRRG